MKIAFDAVVITYEKGKVGKELVHVTAGSIEDLGLAVHRAGRMYLDDSRYWVVSDPITGTNIDVGESRRGAVRSARRRVHSRALDFGFPDREYLDHCRMHWSAC